MISLEIYLDDKWQHVQTFENPDDAKRRLVYFISNWWNTAYRLNTER